MLWSRFGKRLGRRRNRFKKVEDFDVKDGILVKYSGAGGDVKTPEGVTEVVAEA